MEGWIKVHRKLQDNFLWNCEPFSKGQAWIDLIMLASVIDNYVYIRGVRVDIKRGQLAWSEEKLCSRWGWSRTKLRNFLKILKKERQIFQEKYTVIQIVTVINYDEFQKKERQKIQLKNTLKEEDIYTISDKDIYTILYKERESKIFHPPTLDEIKKFCIDKNIDINCEKFFYHYNSVGWKVGNRMMKDWRSAVHKWKLNDFNSKSDNNLSTDALSVYKKLNKKTLSEK